ncbi:hypothetical protein B0293_36650 [Amycolatopsis azurea DSM 43854]|uniref:Uncharacterized protein n=1 Tax=Amycolatopsis azurea DSM 43854 TaxID=1238180 RepID=A0ABX3J4A6_9PSEU|nr:hypothetical protein B0293_36650 [Amycolatopsis azurea DSM 43854]
MRLLAPKSVKASFTTFRVGKEAFTDRASSQPTPAAPLQYMKDPFLAPSAVKGSFMYLDRCESRVPPAEPREGVLHAQPL